MKAVDMFSGFARQAAQDKQIRKYGILLVRHGTSGLAKLNPTAVWVDAACAVLEASESYLRYRADCEVTRQIQEHNRMLEITLRQTLKIREVELDALRQERSTGLSHIERMLQVDRVQTHLTRQKIRTQLDILRRIQALLQGERLQSGPFRQILDFQICLDDCMDASLALLLEPTGA